MTHGGDRPVQSGLTIEVTPEGRIPVVAVGGEIDAASVDMLRASVEGLADDGQVQQVLDLSRVGFLDSSGLGALVSLRRRLENDGGELLVVCDGNDVVLRLLRLTNLDTVLSVYPTVADALGEGTVG